MGMYSINPKRMHMAFLRGANAIIKSQDELNMINVFPVADADTGSNLSATMKAIIECAKVFSGVGGIKKTMQSIAEAAISGSRGNSGIIFSQFIYGLSQEIEDRDTLKINNFSQAVMRATDYPYKALLNPVEGTILTVMRDWAEAVYSLKDKTDDFAVLMKSSIIVARSSLEQTAKQMLKLKNTNIVDAGAKGFVNFLEGVLSSNIVVPRNNNISNYTDYPEDNHNEITYRYCTEILMDNLSATKDTMLSGISNLGDSCIVADFGERTRVHIHSNYPSKVVEKVRTFGNPISQKVEDMVRQNQTAHSRVSNIAIVTDSACDLPQDLIDKYQIHVVPITISFGDEQYLDKLTLTPHEFYQRLSESNKSPLTSQPSESTFYKMYSYLTKHYESVIAIHLSHGLSGTYNSSRLAAQRLSDKNITVIDSKHLSGSLGLVVLRAAEAVKNSLSHDEIVKNIDSWIENSKIYVGVKTLKYMIRGGRLSYVKGFFANILNIRPIVSLNKEGKGTAFGKYFGQKGCLRAITNLLKNDVNISSKVDYVLLHSNAEKSALKYKKILFNAIGKEPLYIMDISPVIGLNAGNETVAIAYITK